jgi:hypothetical protein
MFQSTRTSFGTSARWKSRPYLTLLAGLAECALAAALMGCAAPQATPVIPESYQSYWSEALGIAFEIPPEVGITEYPAYGGFMINGSGGEWTLRGMVVNQRYEENVAQDFDYLYGMRPEDLLDALQNTSGFGEPEGEYQSLVALEGTAQYVRVANSEEGYLVVGAVGTPEHLILLAGQASPEQESAMMEIFSNVLASARFASEMPSDAATETP